MQSGGQGELQQRLYGFYAVALATLSQANVPFLVGGAYALAHYTGIVRHTKDLDIFARPDDCERILQVLAKAGYHPEHTAPHWIAKVFSGEDYIDVIFNSGNGISPVDDAWFAHAVEAEVFGYAVQLCPPEETIWSKAFVMERERYDGADVAHLLRACGEHLDWCRLLHRFGGHWRVLLSHLILFGFIYPAELARIPAWVMQELLDQVRHERRSPPPAERVCQGTLLSRAEYLIDIEQWGYEDARVLPRGPMTPQEIARWTAAIDRDQST
jgi:putative nucleotidyltransferase-like protein